ncbi:unnamed protein product [Amoebophrya sp. A120]|nr:unnamed protein product [Amoebophrya sp. A120]|eukprot:GSA120T00009949001.1
MLSRNKPLKLVAAVALATTRETAAIAAWILGDGSSSTAGAGGDEDSKNEQNSWVDWEHLRKLFSLPRPPQGHRPKSAKFLAPRGEMWEEDDGEDLVVSLHDANEAANHAGTTHGAPDSFLEKEEEEQDTSSDGATGTAATGGPRQDQHDIFAAPAAKETAAPAPLQLQFPTLKNMLKLVPPPVPRELSPAAGSSTDVGAPQEEEEPSGAAAPSSSGSTAGGDSLLQTHERIAGTSTSENPGVPVSVPRPADADAPAPALSMPGPGRDELPFEFPTREAGNKLELNRPPPPPQESESTSAGSTSSSPQNEYPAGPSRSAVEEDSTLLQKQEDNTKALHDHHDQPPVVESGAEVGPASSPPALLQFPTPESMLKVMPPQNEEKGEQQNDDPLLHSTSTTAEKNDSAASGSSPKDAGGVQLTGEQEDHFHDSGSPATRTPPSLLQLPPAAPVVGAGKLGQMLHPEQEVGREAEHLQSPRAPPGASTPSDLRFPDGSGSQDDQASIDEELENKAKNFSRELHGDQEEQLSQPELAQSPASASFAQRAPYGSVSFFGRQPARSQSAPPPSRNPHPHAHPQHAGHVLAAEHGGYFLGHPAQQGQALAQPTLPRAQSSPGGATSSNIVPSWMSNVGTNIGSAVTSVQAAVTCAAESVKADFMEFKGFVLRNEAKWEDQDAHDNLHDWALTRYPPPSKEEVERFSSAGVSPHGLTEIRVKRCALSGDAATRLLEHFYVTFTPVGGAFEDTGNANGQNGKRRVVVAEFEAGGWHVHEPVSLLKAGDSHLEPFPQLAIPNLIAHDPERVVISESPICNIKARALAEKHVEQEFDSYLERIKVSPPASFPSGFVQRLTAHNQKKFDCESLETQLAELQTRLHKPENWVSVANIHLQKQLGPENSHRLAPVDQNVVEMQNGVARISAALERCQNEVKQSRYVLQQLWTFTDDFKSTAYKKIQDAVDEAAEEFTTDYLLLAKGLHNGNIDSLETNLRDVVTQLGRARGFNEGLDRRIKNHGRGEESQYHLLKHNCQHFTNDLINLWRTSELMWNISVQSRGLSTFVSPALMHDMGGRERVIYQRGVSVLRRLHPDTKPLVWNIGGENLQLYQCALKKKIWPRVEQIHSEFQKVRDRLQRKAEQYWQIAHALHELHDLENEGLKQAADAPPVQGSELDFWLGAATGRTGNRLDTEARTTMTELQSTDETARLAERSYQSLMVFFNGHPGDCPRPAPTALSKADGRPSVESHFNSPKGNADVVVGLHEREHYDSSRHDSGIPHHGSGDGRRGRTSAAGSGADVASRHQWVPRVKGDAGYLDRDGRPASGRTPRPPGTRAQHPWEEASTSAQATIHPRHVEQGRGQHELYHHHLHPVSAGAERGTTVRPPATARPRSRGPAPSSVVGAPQLSSRAAQQTVRPRSQPSAVRAGGAGTPAPDGYLAQVPSRGRDPSDQGPRGGASRRDPAQPPGYRRRGPVPVSAPEVPVPRSNDQRTPSGGRDALQKAEQTEQRLRSFKAGRGGG